MPNVKFTNNASSALAGALTTGSTALVVTPGDGIKFPVLAGGDWFMATLAKVVGGAVLFEIIKVTARTTDTFTILRAQEGTTALTFSTADKVENRITAGAINGKAEAADVTTSLALKANLVAPAFVGSSNSGKSTLTGSSTTLALALVNAAEKITLVAAAATGTIAIDVTTQSLLFHTVAAASSWVINVRGNATNTIDSLMAIGESVTVSMWATQGTTAYMPSSYQIDGVVVTPRWLGGTAPVAGNASAIDLYTLTIVKTAAAAFTMIASAGTAK